MINQHILSRRALALKRSALVAAALIASSGAAIAFTAPTTTDLGYDIYDIVVNQGIKGAPGFVAAAIFIVFGFGSLFQQRILPGIFGLVAGAALFAADNVVTSLGFTV